jgi:two-component system sensor histidine kinase SenX3
MVSMPLWRLAGRDVGVHGRGGVRPPPALPDVALETAQAFGGYAIAVTPAYQVVYCSADADTLPCFTGTKLAHPYLRALTDEAWTDMETVVRHTAFTTLGPVAEAEVRATRLADRYVLLTIADQTDLVRTRDIRHDFIANIGHELRTPITAVEVIAATLEAAAADSQAVAHFSGRLKTEARRLARLTEDVLALAKAQEADSTCFEAVSVADAVRTALERQRIASEAKRIALRLQVSGCPTVWGDGEALTTAVENLVSNAINYSPSDSTVDVGVKEGGAPREAVITVADRGIGIASADQERVFERFYRADQARSRRTGGTGLGLAIVRNTVAGHGGQVALRSKPGSGSIVTVRLPLLTPKETP